MIVPSMADLSNSKATPRPDDARPWALGYIGYSARGPGHGVPVEFQDIAGQEYFGSGRVAHLRGGGGLPQALAGRDGVAGDRGLLGGNGEHFCTANGHDKNEGDALGTTGAGR